MVRPTRHNVSICDVPPLVSEAKVFAIGFEDGSSNSSDSTLGLLTSTFKETTTCKGAIREHRCTLNPRIVEYSVILRNDTISLQYPHWQNDTFLKDVHEKRHELGVQGGTLLPLLFPPVQLNITYYGGTDSFSTRLYQGCGQDRFASNTIASSNTSCPIEGRGQGLPLGDNNLLGQYLNRVGDPSCDQDRSHHLVLAVIPGVIQCRYLASNILSLSTTLSS